MAFKNTQLHRIIMKAILIARVSTEEQKEAGLSLPAQIVRLEKYCQGKNFPIIKSFSLDDPSIQFLAKLEITQGERELIKI